MTKRFFLLTAIFFLLTAIVMALASIGGAQSNPIRKEMLVGTWKLVAASNVTDENITIEAYAES